MSQDDKLLSRYKVALDLEHNIDKKKCYKLLKYHPYQNLHEALENCNGDINQLAKSGKGAQEMQDLLLNAPDLLNKSSQNIPDDAFKHWVDLQTNGGTGYNKIEPLYNDIKKWQQLLTPGQFNKAISSKDMPQNMSNDFIEKKVDEKRDESQDVDSIKALVKSNQKFKTLRKWSSKFKKAAASRVKSWKARLKKGAKDTGRSL